MEDEEKEKEGGRRTGRGKKKKENFYQSLLSIQSTLNQTLRTLTYFHFFVLSLEITQKRRCYGLNMKCPQRLIC
jgi:hypothetical protein